MNSAWPPPPEPTRQPAHTGAPSPFRVAERTGPIIDGVECPCGGFFDPRRAACPRCGTAATSGAPTRRPRPSVGRLVFDSGQRFEIDGGLLVGRSCAADTLVTSGELRAAVPSGDVSGLSRKHATITTADWDIELTDLDSLNGTFWWSPSGRRWHRLPERQAVRIRVGDAIAFGRRTATVMHVTRR